MKKKSIISILVTLCLTSAMSFSVAGKTKTPITSITLAANLQLSDGDDLNDLTWGDSDSGADITKSGSRYWISDVVWVGGKSPWTIGDKPKVKVTLTADEGNYFTGTYNSKKVSIKGGTLVSAKVNDMSTLDITVQLKTVKGEVNAPDEIMWSDTKIGQGTWSKVPGVSAYEARLYRGGKLIHRYERVNGVSHNFFPYMTQAGNYTFMIRPVPINEEQKKYMVIGEWGESGDFYVDYDQVSDGKGQEKVEDGLVDGVGGWVKIGGNWFFQYPDGSCQVDSWMPLDGNWYLFDKDGRMLTGWQKHNERYYYLFGDGRMAAGWLLDGNQWYYLGPSGDMQTGWLFVQNQWYFLNKDGSMVKGWMQIDGKWYYFNESNGTMASNTNVGYFHVNEDGVWIP